jgi:transposase-like protein
MITLEQKIVQQFQEDLKNCKTINDFLRKDGAIKNLIKNVAEQLLEAELTNHLGYEKYSVEKNNKLNSRNGKSKKTLRSDYGEIEIGIPRDRNGEFEPILIPKYEKTIGELDDKIISLYSRGMTVRDIQSHLQELYGIDVSPAFISSVSEKVFSLIQEWQSRPLDKIYTVLYLDAIHFKIRDNGKVVTKASYTVFGINTNGFKDVLGIWIGENEGSNFWLSVLTELKNRGVEDILIACVDGLKGFPEAITSVFPKAEIQQCIIHQIRNSLKYVSSKDQKSFMSDLKLVYKAPTEDKAIFELKNLEEKWIKKYPIVINSWKNNWSNLSTYFKYPEEIRKIIYTTNIIESLHRQLRKVTKTKSIFPNDDALKKILYLAQANITKKWTQPIHNWALIISHFNIIFEGRLEINL